MCLTKTPSAPAPPPPPQYLHNPYLDSSEMNDGGLNKGRDSLVNLAINNGVNTRGGAGGLPIAPTVTGPVPRPGAGTPSSPNGGLTLPAGTAMPGTQLPAMISGQPGSVVPTVGGVMAGAMAGRVVSPTAPPAAAVK